MSSQLVVIILTLILFGIPLGAEMREYVVKEGDTLSDLIYRHFGSPLYGKKGRLLAVIRMNPHILDPNHVAPGSIVLVDSSWEGDAIPLATHPIKIKECSIIEKNSGVEPLPQAVEKSNSLDHFEVSLLSSFSGIQAFDRANHANATFGSNLNVGAEIFWSQQWTSSFVTALQSSIQKTSLYSEIDQRLVGPSPTIGEIHVEMGFRLNPHLTMSFQPGISGRIFTRGISDGEISLDSVMVPQAAFRLKEVILKRGSREISLLESVYYLAPFSQTSYSGMGGFGFKVQVRLDLRSEKLFFAGIAYDYSRQNSTLTIQSQSEVSSFFGMGFDFLN